MTPCDGQGVNRGNESGSRASPGGRPGAALPRVRGPLDPADRRPTRSLAGNGQGVLLRPSDANKGPSWEREAELGGRELRSHVPAAAPRGEILPRRAIFCAGLAVQLFRWLGFSCSTGLRNGAVRRNSPATIETMRVCRSRRSLVGWDAQTPPSRRISTIQPAIRHARSRRATAGVCRGCGAPTAARNGKGDAYAYCKRCHPGAIAREWTRERVREAMRGLAERATALRPSSYDWSRTHARRRGGEALERHMPENGPRRPPSSTYTGPGRWPSRTPSAAPERSGARRQSRDLGFVQLARRDGHAHPARGVNS